MYREGDHRLNIYDDLHAQIPIVPERKIETIAVPRHDGTILLYKPENIAAIDIHLSGINLLTLYGSRRYFDFPEENTTPILMWYYDKFGRRRRIVVDFDRSNDQNIGDNPFPPSA